jgi:hypothetical protein
MTDLVVIKGLRTGHVNISVKINEKGYRHVAPAKVTVYVKENFVLIPDYALYVLPHSIISYNLSIISFTNGKVSKRSIYTCVKESDVV